MGAKALLAHRISLGLGQRLLVSEVGQAEVHGVGVLGMRGWDCEPTELGFKATSLQQAGNMCFPRNLTASEVEGPPSLREKTCRGGGTLRSGLVSLCPPTWGMHGVPKE